MTNRETAIYKDRFENAFRVAKKITSCLNIGDILEIIRDEVKITIPHAEQACLILVDPDAPAYTLSASLRGRERKHQLPSVQARERHSPKGIGTTHSISVRFG